MKFSIIIPTYNSETYINELMNSLKDQTLNKQDYEVIVVDDCSTDDTLKIVEKYKNKMNLIIEVPRCLLCGDRDGLRAWKLLQSILYFRRSIADSINMVCDALLEIWMHPQASISWRLSRYLT